MKHSAWMLAATLLLNVNVSYADINPDVTQGDKKYEWQSCFETNKSNCVNNCINSEDIDCAGNCDALAKDKCQAAGLTPPQDISN